jgi:hypothetical protein
VLLSKPKNPVIYLRNLENHFFIFMFHIKSEVNLRLQISFFDFTTCGFISEIGTKCFVSFSHIKCSENGMWRFSNSNYLKNNPKSLYTVITVFDSQKILMYLSVMQTFILVMYIFFSSVMRETINFINNALFSFSVTYLHLKMNPVFLCTIFCVFTICHGQNILSTSTEEVMNYSLK